MMMLAEKEKYEASAEKASQQYFTSLEEIKLQELQIAELNSKIKKDTLKLKNKQSLYETLRSDRNLYSKQLLQLNANIAEHKHTFHSMNYKIDKMKEDITQKV